MQELPDKQSSEMTWISRGIKPCRGLQVKHLTYNSTSGLCVQSQKGITHAAPHQPKAVQKDFQI